MTSFPMMKWKKAHSRFHTRITSDLSSIWKRKNPPAILPIQIAYYAGLRIGETCGLTWQDINLEEQCLTIKRSIRYDGIKHKNIIGPTKRKKVRIVDFGDTLTEILKAARKEQLKNRMQYGELYHRNYYKEVHVKNRVYYEYYHLAGTQEVPADYKEISFVCLRRMALWNCRVHSALYADQCQRNWKDLKISISTSYVTPTPAICFPMGLHRKMYRNC